MLPCARGFDIFERFVGHFGFGGCFIICMLLSIMNEILPGAAHGCVCYCISIRAQGYCMFPFIVANN